MGFPCTKVNLAMIAVNPGCTNPVLNSLSLTTNQHACGHKPTDADLAAAAVPRKRQA